MQRDMDLIRKILITVEEATSTLGTIEVKIDGYTEQQIAYHVALLREAGLLHAVDLSSKSGLRFLPTRLTWEGHEFLDAARNDSLWRKTKEAAGKVGSLTFDAFKSILIQLGIEAARGYLSLPPP